MSSMDGCVLALIREAGCLNTSDGMGSWGVFVWLSYWMPESTRHGRSVLSDAPAPTAGIDSVAI